MDGEGIGIISTQQLTDLIQRIDPENVLNIRDKDIIEFGDPTFYGNITFNYYTQALSQSVVLFDQDKMSILKYVNEISD